MTVAAESAPFYKCVKCHEKGEYFGLDIKKAVYCQPCFIHMVKHKFCFLLGKHKIFKDTQPENALLIYNGDAASALLLALVKKGVEEVPSRRLRIVPSVLVLLSGSHPTEVADQFLRINSILKEFAPTWKVSFVHLAAVLEPHLSFDATNWGDEEPCEVINGFNKLTDYFTLLNSIESNSLRNEMGRILQNILIFRAGRALNCPKVIIPENMESLANTSLNVLCLGRGPAISHLTAVIDQRVCTPDDPSSPVLIRPLRDICNREIELFHQLEGTQHLITMNPSDCSNSKSTSNGGLQSITADFLTTLQAAGYPSTTTTILSVCSKVEPLCRGESQEIRCSMCLCPYFKDEDRNGEEDSSAWTNCKLCRTCLNILQEIGEDVVNNFLHVLNIT